MRVHLRIQCSLGNRLLQIVDQAAAMEHFRRVVPSQKLVQQLIAKQLVRPVRGFKTLKTAYATIKGFEVMRALRKGQAGPFALEGGIVGEAKLVERGFGLGPCALTVAVALLQDRLANAES